MADFIKLSEYVYVGADADTRPSAPVVGARAIVYDTGGEEMYDGTAWRSVAGARGGYSASVSLTRTADTAAYLANDVLGASISVSAALTFANVGPSGGRIVLTTAELEIDRTAVIAGETSYRLYLYDVTPPSALVDNAAWDLPAGDRASYLGYVDLGTPVDLGSTLYVRTDKINAQFKLAGTSLFGYLVTNGAYTPQSATVHKITLHVAVL